MRVAVVTMVYNEPVFLPLWLRHYGNQVGPENLFVIDHGSDDGSTDALGSGSLLRLPRSPQDDRKRARMVSNVVTGLLDYYDAVINVDVDELVVADPSHYSSLTDYAGRTEHMVVTALGLNVTHRPALEAPIDLQQSILSQRQWVRLVSPMTKPVFVRRPVQWTLGFHRCDAEPRFDELYLFHLRYFDQGLGLDRLAKTRSMPWASASAGAHQKVSDDHWLTWFSQFDAMGDGGDLFAPDAAPAFMQRFAAGAGLSPNGEPNYVHETSPVLYRVPERFASLL